ncbi:MAG: DoxX family protein [Bacteroidales bacterium]|nr:DoxX family protein [Bacteroidales bacterium]
MILKTLKVLLRIITGAVFIFSGTVKAIDPMGSAFKFSDYFSAFGIDFLQPLSLPLAIILCLAEFISGFAVLTGIRYREGLLGILILMAIFTPLTLVLAITNPVTDCGCFGDAVKLTNWQTFEKNILLSAFIVILFFDKNKTHGFLIDKPTKGWLTIAAVSLIFLGFTFYNLIYLPVIDFLPYKKGNNLKELMTIPEGAPAPVFKTTFIYEKNGIRKEFSLDDYPANDTTWKFVDQKSIMIKKGYEPPVHDFAIITIDGKDITDSVLNNQGYSLLMISRKLEQAKAERIEKGLETGRKCIAQGIDFYILTSSETEKVKKFDNGLKFCLADETTLKTMMRTNPGYIMLKNGVVTGKWSWANLPDNIEKLIKQK